MATFEIGKAGPQLLIGAVQSQWAFIWHAHGMPDNGCSMVNLENALYPRAAGGLEPALA